MTNVIIDEMPITLDLPPIVPGADWEWTFYILDDNGDPVSLTSWSFKMDLRVTPNGELVKALTSSPAAGITVTAGSGRVDIRLDDTETAVIDVKQVVWDLFSTDASSNVDCPFKGTVQVLDRVTK